MLSFVGGGGKTTLMFALAKELLEAGRRVLTTTTTKILRPTEEQSTVVVVAPHPLDAIRGKGPLPHAVHITAAMAEQPDTSKLVGYRPEILDAVHEAGVFDWILVEADGSRQKPLKAPAPHEPVVPEHSDVVVAVLGLDALGLPLSHLSVFRPEIVEKVTGQRQGEPITEETVATLFCADDGIFGRQTSAALRYAFLNKADVGDGLAAGKRVAELMRRQNAKVNQVFVGAAQSETPIWYAG